MKGNVEAADYILQVVKRECIWALNLSNTSGHTALILAPACDIPPSFIVKLLDAGCKLECSDNLNKTAITYAIEYNNVTALEVILQFIKTNNLPQLLQRKNKRCYTYLQLAVINGNKNIVNMLLKLKNKQNDFMVDVNEKSGEDDTVLHVAVTQNIEIKILKLLLSRQDIDINYKRKNTVTCLHIALEEELLETVRLLKIHGGLDNDEVTKMGENFGPIEDELRYPNMDYDLNDDNWEHQEICNLKNIPSKLENQFNYKTTMSGIILIFIGLLLSTLIGKAMAISKIDIIIAEKSIYYKIMNPKTDILSHLLVEETYVLFCRTPLPFGYIRIICHNRETVLRSELHCSGCFNLIGDNNYNITVIEHIKLVPLPSKQREVQIKFKTRQKQSMIYQPPIDLVIVYQYFVIFCFNMPEENMIFTIQCHNYLLRLDISTICNVCIEPFNIERKYILKRYVSIRTVSHFNGSAEIRMNKMITIPKWVEKKQ